MLKFKLSALLAITFALSACDSTSENTPPAKPTSKTYNAQLQEGIRMKVEVKLPTDPAATSTAMKIEVTKLQADLTWIDYAQGTGDCEVPAATDDSGITTCHITAATGLAASGLLDHYLRFQVTDGIWMVIQILAAADYPTASKLYLFGGLSSALNFGILTDDHCNDLVGTYTSVGTEPQSHSYFEFNSTTKHARHADFGFTQNGSSYTSLYTTTSPDVSGLENVLDVKCKDGYRMVSYVKSGSTKSGYLFQTTSGALFDLGLFSNLSFWVDSTKTLAAKTMANKKFKGVFVSLGVGAAGVAVNFKVAASGADGAMVTEYNIPTGFPPGSSDAFSPTGTVIRPINATSAAAIFSSGSAASKTSALNALAGTVSDASDIPGLNYTDKSSATGTSPHLFMTWKTPSGKQAVIILHTIRKTAPTIALNGITTAIEE